MKNCREYIALTVSDGSNHFGIRIPAFRILSYRLSNKIWGLHKRTKLRSFISKGTRLIFYVSGKRENSKCFVAEAVVKEIAPWRSSIDIRRYTKEEQWQYDIPYSKIELASIRWFKHYVSIYDIKEKMSIFRGQKIKYWGVFIQGGAFRVQESDYSLIKRKSLD